MANFLNKLGDMAKNAADKTGEMIEIGKLNTKISAEQTKISDLKQKIGNFYYDRFSTEENFPAEVAELCQQINLCEEAIASVQAEICVLKGEPRPDDTEKCPSCGVSNSAGTKFCSSCGAKLPI